MANNGKNEQGNVSQPAAAVASQEGSAQRNGQKSKAQGSGAAAQTMINTTSPQQAAADDENEEMNQSDQEEVSDDEDSACLMRMESEIALPRAPVKQLIMDKLPQNARIHQQSKELISTLCMHFLMQLTEESNTFCNGQNKKTVCPDHVLDALAKMNLTRYFPKLAGQDEPKSVSKPARKGSKAAAAKAAKKDEGDDLAKLKTDILKRLSLSMKGGKAQSSSRGRGNKNENRDDGLTDEQKNFEQEQLFREAREQLDRQQAAAAESLKQPQYAGARIGGSKNDAAMGNDCQMDAAMVDQSIPAFNPTDFFRDTIFTTDFLGNAQSKEEEPAEMAVADQTPEEAGAEPSESQPGEDVPQEMMAPNVVEPLQEPSGFFDLDDDDGEMEFEFDEDELAELRKAQAAVATATNGKPQPEKAQAASGQDQRGKQAEPGDQEMKEESKGGAQDGL